MAAPGEREAVDVSGGRGLASSPSGVMDTRRQSPAGKDGGRGRGVEITPGGKNSAPCPQLFTCAGNLG